ncbi:MAG TPA: hypothetical protein VGO92_07875 [Acidimicrobiales bacterium]|jgi:hypothetical protein|nr:hypothetical protein [Acidimicrobiales bacterium]
MPEQPSNAPTDSETTVTGVDPDNAQENVGRENMVGGGEWPSPSTPPRGPASGETSRDDATPFRRPRVAEGFDPPTATEALEADPVRGGTSTAGDPDAGEPD